MHEYAKKCIRYSIPNTINNTTPNIFDKIYTHSMQGFSGYIKQSILHSSQKHCSILNAIYMQDHKIKHYSAKFAHKKKKKEGKQKSNYNHGVSISVITYICMLIVTMCIRKKSKLGMGVEIVSFTCFL